MNTTGRLQDLVGSESFEHTSNEPVVSFVLDNGEIFGALLSHLTDARYHPETEKLVLRWPVGIVEVRGPKALEFYKAFAKGRGSWAKADGADILSVTFIAPPKRP
jgi:hypothetical protein